MKLVKNGNVNRYPLIRNRNKKLFEMLNRMKKGDILEVTMKDFSNKYPYPHPAISNYTHRTKYKFSIRTLEGKKKWIIIRL